MYVGNSVELLYNQIIFNMKNICYTLTLVRQLFLVCALFYPMISYVEV